MEQNPYRSPASQRVFYRVPLAWRALSIVCCIGGSLFAAAIGALVVHEIVLDVFVRIEKRASPARFIDEDALSVDRYLFAQRAALAALVAMSVAFAVFSISVSAWCMNQYFARQAKRTEAARDSRNEVPTRPASPARPTIDRRQNDRGIMM